MFQATTATQKILKLTKRIRGVSGGTGASKTISILLWLIDYAQTHRGKVISIVSESLPHLKRGAMRDFLNIMSEHEYYKDENWNKSDFIYTFPTGTKIEFFGVEESEKVKGARRDILYVNEANNITLETFMQLEIRTREIIWCDWNPVAEFWWYTEIMPHYNADFLVLTYLDNEALPQSIVQSIESKRHNKNWWRIYGEGQLGIAEGRIFDNWEILDQVPFVARLDRYGLDFGYTNDPTAIVADYNYNGGIVLDELAYQKGLSNKTIADIFINSPRALVIADSSEPKSIDEIKSYGVNIIPAEKGKGSVLQGIQYMQDKKIYVTKRSVNLLKEYRNYFWLTDREGNFINEPQDFMNHCLDAARYAIGKPRKTFTMPQSVGGIKPFFEGLPG